VEAGWDSWGSGTPSPYLLMQTPMVKNYYVNPLVSNKEMLHDMEFKRKVVKMEKKLSEIHLQPLLIFRDILQNISVYSFGIERKESNLLTMTLRKIQHPTTNRRQRNKRSGASMPQL
jgi:hypothetical protein